LVDPRINPLLSSATFEVKWTLDEGFVGIGRWGEGS
jgi:hypothetical protein